MRVEFKASDLFTVIGEGTTQKEAFESVASGIEPFTVGACGACNSKNIIPRVRHVDDFTYYEMQCRKCWSKLSYGQAKKGGGIYPRRKFHKDHPLVKSGEAEVGEALPNGGWEKWIPDQENEDGEMVPAKVGKKK